MTASVIENKTSPFCLGKLPCGVFAIMAVLAMVFCAEPALAAKKTENVDAAVKFVQSLGDDAISMLTVADISDEERRKNFKTLLDKSFDMRTIARFAMGRYWRAATKEQKREYFELFQEMVIDVYSNRFKEYSGEKFEVDSGLADTEDDVIVRSYIVRDTGNNILIEWRVRQKDDGLKIVDVVVEGISMSVTQRSDFASVIETGGGEVQALVDSLKERQNL